MYRLGFHSTVYCTTVTDNGTSNYVMVCTPSCLVCSGQCRLAIRAEQQLSDRLTQASMH